MSRIKNPFDLKIVYVFLFLVSGYTSLKAQWSWVNGNSFNPNPSLTYIKPIFGAQGVPSSVNSPGTLVNPSTWKDNKGNIWVYSGSNDHNWQQPINNTYPAACVDHLWKYNTNTMQWTWVKGTGNSIPVYGIKGVSSPSNHPGGERGATWIDLNGDLWLLGYVYTSTQSNLRSSDVLWKYSVANNEWTWMYGSNAIVPSGHAEYGTLNVPSASNRPTPRENSITWTDKNGNLWLIGGNSLVDVWMFNMSIKQWVWKGGLNYPNVIPDFGIKGVAAPGNHPGSGEFYGGWIDNNGIVYFFHGWNNYAIGGLWNGPLSATLWKYDPASNLFTWVSGTNLGNNNQGMYGTKCIPSSTNYPSSRFMNSMGEKDDCGNFWMFGGMTLNNSTDPLLNDLWKYNPKLNEWTWVSGSNVSGDAGSFGIIGQSSSANRPPARGNGISAYNKEIFVGYGSTLDDMWLYRPKPIAAFSSKNDNNSCANLLIHFKDESTPECGGDLKSWFWDFGDGQTSTLQHPDHEYATEGNYTVSLIASNCFSITDTITHIITVKNNHKITTTINTIEPTCTQPGSISIAVSGNFPPYSYLWNTGAQTPQVTNLSAGNYYCVITDSKNCTDTVKVTLINSSTPLTTLQINPVKCFGESTGSVHASPVTGGAPPYSYSWNTGQTSLSLNQVPAGNYTITITDAAGCKVNYTANVTEPSKLTITSNILATSCGLNNGSATLLTTGGTTPYSYLWTPILSTSASVNNLSPGNYSAIVTDKNLCRDSVKIVIAASNGVKASFSCDQKSGCTPLCVTFINTSVPAGGTAHWNFGDGTAATGDVVKKCYQQEGKFNVSLLIEKSGCKDSLKMPGVVQTYATPKTAFLYQDLGGNIIEFTNQSLNAQQWNWDFGDQHSSTLISPVHEYNPDTINFMGYKVCLFTFNHQGACKDTLCKIIELNDFILFIPNAITVNNDGKNDSFTPKGTGVSSFEMMIFNRWGELIFTSHSLAEGWDGKFRGQFVQEDTYIYSIKVTNLKGREYKYNGLLHVIH